MAFNYSPKIVTSNLVLYLDAANTRSYPTTGTTWSDLSRSGNNGTLTNGPTFNSANGGSIVFDGVDDYVSSFTSQISSIGSRTIMCYFKTSNTTRSGLCSTRSSSGGGFNFLINRVVGGLTYSHIGGSILEVSAGITINTWYCACVTYNVSTTTAILYLNGNQIGSPSTSFSTMSSTSFNGVIGAEDDVFSGKLSGNIAQLSMYNRALTVQEVLQNYNATKSRFNIF